MHHAFRIPPKYRFRFLAKIAAALGLLALGDLLFYGFQGGSVIALFGLAWIAAVALARPVVRASREGLIALDCAGGFTLILFDDPSLLAAVLFLIAMGTATLLPRHGYDHAGRWFLRLAALGVRGPFRVLGDLARVMRIPSRSKTHGRVWLVNVAIPLLGGAIFLAMFANANPVLGSALSAIRLPDLWTLILHAILWAFLLALIWPSLRPSAYDFAMREGHEWQAIPSLPVLTLILTLISFNAVFAVENMLDIVFLWSGAPLPGTVTLADYAHRGAYTLIATALMAGLFVLVALRPGTEAAQSVTVRRLVLLWVGQNILLVASSILRLVDYIDAFSLTIMRISALLWMVLVGTGLLLICWRFLTGRSLGWLVNANAIAAAVALVFASVVDLGAMAAWWNVRHLRDQQRIDLCYLGWQGGSSLLPLIELSHTGKSEDLRERALWLARKAEKDVRRTQADWQGWSWRDARRLARAEALLADDARIVRKAPYGRDCSGKFRPPPPAPNPALWPEEAATEAAQPDAAPAPEPKPLTQEPKK